MVRFTDSLIIIIVIYNRDLEACESFQSVLAMRNDECNLNVFVYDNSSTSQSIKEYDGLRISYFHDAKNSGVSTAYNAGVTHAVNNQKKWALLLDQDTLLPDSILKDYENSIRANQDSNLFVPILKLKNDKIFSPSRYKFKRGFFVEKIAPGVHSLFKYAPVNSGMMVNIAAFQEVGGYNEKVQLDFSDFQFVERFRKVFPRFYVMNTECLQDFSDDDSSYSSQAVRFRYFCQGARNVDNKDLINWFQYNAVVLMRTLRLTLKYGKLGFFGTYFSSFLFASKS